jgi:hypothetical protein
MTFMQRRPIEFDQDYCPCTFVFNVVIHKYAASHYLLNCHRKPTNYLRRQYFLFYSYLYNVYRVKSIKKVHCKKRLAIYLFVVAMLKGGDQAGVAQALWLLAQTPKDAGDIHTENN